MGSAVSIGKLRESYEDVIGGMKTGWPLPMDLLEPDTSDILKRVPQELAFQPYLLAQMVYGDPVFFWVIPMVNRMEDPILGLTSGRSISIPLLSRVIAAVREWSGSW